MRFFLADNQQIPCYYGTQSSITVFLKPAVEP